MASRLDHTSTATHDMSLVAYMTPLENAQWVVEEERRLRALGYWPDDDLMFAKMCLSTGWRVWQALLLGDPVPVEALDPIWVGKFRRRGLL